MTINYYDQEWRTRNLQIYGGGVSDVSFEYRYPEGDRVSLVVSGPAAVDLINQMKGNAPLPSNLSGNQEDALASARRAADEATQRAEAAERLAQEARDEVSDYIGEIAALRSELDEAKRPVFSIDPSTGFRNGGVIATPGTSHHGVGRSLIEQTRLRDQWHQDYLNSLYGRRPEPIRSEVLGAFKQEAEPEPKKLIPGFNLEQYEKQKYTLEGE